MLRVSKSKLYAERKAGRLQVLQFGRCVRVDSRDIDRYLRLVRQNSGIAGSIEGPDDSY